MVLRIVNILSISDLQEIINNKVNDANDSIENMHFIKQSNMPEAAWPQGRDYDY